jgi:hypothetical protein
MSRISTKQPPARAATAPNPPSSSPPPALLPERADDTQANALLERDGAVILTGRTVSRPSSSRSPPRCSAPACGSCYRSRGRRPTPPPSAPAHDGATVLSSDAW